MKKEVYTGAELKITMFADDSIITASVAQSPTRNPNDPIELPFIPAEI